VTSRGYEAFVFDLLSCLQLSGFLSRHGSTLICGHKLHCTLLAMATKPGPWPRAVLCCLAAVAVLCPACCSCSPRPAAAVSNLT
jgi:hypothetical protein